MNIGPSPLFDLFGAGAFRAIAGGVKIGLFDTIGTRSLTSEELSIILKCDRNALEMLVEFLCSTGYLEKRNDRYSNSDMTKKWMLNDSAFKEMFSVWDDEVFPFWDKNFLNTLKNGSPPRTIYQEFDNKPGTWESFNSFEMALARWLGNQLLSTVKLHSSATRLLDVGGGHGMYSIIFCEKYPKLQATILDREESLKIARKNIESRDLQARIQLKNGDMLSEPLGTNYDVALLINILHNFKSEENKILLEKVRSALSPSGLVVIYDDIKGPAISKRTVDFFSLAYLITVGGRCYSLDVLKNLLGQAGFGNVKTNIRMPGLVLANVKG
jgi:ubiquinone/menaquinone biosynthesis C-methylase UbiE